MLKFGETGDLTVVSFDTAAIRGGVFGIRAGHWHLVAVSEKKLAGVKDDYTLWRELWRELRGGSGLTLLTGAVPRGVLFCLDAVALPPREQREALFMELPRQMLRPPAEPALQFLPVTDTDADGMTKLNVYVSDQKSLYAATAPLRRGRLRADEFIHPLLVTAPDDPPVFIPGLDSDFYFEGRRFHRTDGTDELKEESLSKWRKIMDELFVRDAEITDFTNFLPVLLVARFAISGNFRRRRRELQFLPAELHPVRFRGQLRLTAVLASALLLMLLWSCGSERWREFSAYRAVVAETRELRRKNDSMQGALKRSSREQKDIAKVLNSNFGEGDVIGQLAAFSKLLPQDVMVTDFRWSESGIDLVLQSESENLDLPRVLKPLTRWKVTDIQQRQGRMSATTTVTAKLIPADQVSGKGKTGKGAKNSRRARK